MKSNSRNRQSPSSTIAQILKMPVDDWAGMAPVSAWLAPACPLHGGSCGTVARRTEEWLRLAMVLERRRAGGAVRHEAFVAAAANGRHLLVVKDEENGTTYVAGLARDLDAAYDAEDFVTEDGPAIGRSR